MKKEDVRTLDDALRICGVTIEQYKAQTNGLPDDVRAYIALRYIVEALNDGWTPSYAAREIRWFVWFDVLSDAEYGTLRPHDKANWPIECRCGRNGQYHHAIARVYQDRSPLVDGQGLMQGQYPIALAFRDESTARYAATRFSEAFLTLCFGSQRSSA
jgi:hypothetical protein